jgi:hypothetical protein
MDWRAWRTHFETYARRPEPEVLEARLVPARWREPLRNSLAKFQLGESGEGRIAHEIDRVQLPSVDADYRAALKRFVAEEGRHARVLAKLVLVLGGRLLHRNWTERLFVQARRMLGVRLKLLVLLAAEVIGIGFYGMLAERLPEGALRRALGEICGDERLHLAFHADFFRAQGTTPFLRRSFWSAWQCIGTAAALAVLIDHAGTLRTMDIPLWGAWRRLRALVGLAAARFLVAPPCSVAGLAASKRRAEEPNGLSLGGSF